ncbi:MAG: glycosyltransferase [Clostridiales bacterium]|nr:glycosyltransferase [Clostridiales bacterium]
MNKKIKENNFISAVIYVHNCAGSIYNFLEMLDTNFNQIYKKYEIICVNDCSQDTSSEEIKKYAQISKGSISILNMSFYQGLELSMNAGMDLAIGDFVYQFDFPIQVCSFDTIYNIYLHSLEGFDIVSAAPKRNEHILSRCFYKLYNNFARSQYDIQTEYFRIISRRAINRVNSLSKTIPYRKAVYANCGLKVDTIIIPDENKKEILEFTHKNKLHENREIASNTLLLYTNIGYKFSMILTSLMMIVMFVMAIYTMIVYIQGFPISGWTSTILFLSFVFIGIFAVLTVMIKYLSLILSLLFTKQEYLIESIEKIK